MTQNVTNISLNSQGSLLAQSARDKFPNPFCDIASEYMPPDIYSMFKLAEYLYNTMPPFKEVSTKVVRYFLTELELEGGSDDEREQCGSVLNNNLRLMRSLGAAGDDYMTYGQSFISLIFPFDRYLVCPDCNAQVNAKYIAFQFVPDANDPHFLCECPSCKNGKKKFTRVDRNSPDKSRVFIKRWNPYQIQIIEHPISGKKEFFLDLTADGTFAQRIKQGDRFMLSETPWPIVKACCKGASATFKFRDGQVYHLCTPSLAGMAFNGWSVPPLLASFKLAYYIQLLRRFDEATILDFVMPFRVMYPKQSGAMDPMGAFNMSSFVTEMKGMVERKRKNITDIQLSPFEIGYQLLGGEAKMMSPKDNITQAMNELLNGSGFPAELYNGTLNWQVMPVALRLFERRWGALVDGFNELLSWIIQEVGRHYHWSPEIQGKLRSITLADDLERKALGLQAAAGGDISKSTGYGPFGYKFEEEQKRVLEEQRMIAKLQQEAAEQDQISQLGGGAAGDPSQQGGYQPTMQDVRDQAQSLAQQLLFQVPEGQRRGQLMRIKQTNPTLHALTLQAMDETRRSMASQGQAMMMEQGRQAAAAGQPPPVKLASQLPSPIAVGMLIQDQAVSYTRAELRKIATDIAIPGVRKAFGFVYGMMTGLDGVL